jgi:hypothetical protein
VPNIVADSCAHKGVCFQPGGGGCVSKCRHWLAVEKFTSANTESMPCVVGIRGEVCRLGFGDKCGTPACQLTRTAHIS